ncbi:MAG: hypothetical protein RLZZ511_2201 [Cyanobacteriota bacterium]|jgi:hypothetical protein
MAQPRFLISLGHVLAKISGGSLSTIADAIECAGEARSRGTSDHGTSDQLIANSTHDHACGQITASNQW